MQAAQRDASVAFAQKAPRPKPAAAQQQPRKIKQAQPAQSIQTPVTSPPASSTAADPYSPPKMDMSKNSYNGLPPVPSMPKMFRGKGPTFGGYGNSHTGAPAGKLSEMIY